MIEIERSEFFSGITVCLCGSQSTTEFMELPFRLADHCRHRQSPRLLFDWSELESWHFSTDASMSAQRWIEVGRAIERAAIVHHHRWNRQAAWLGAALRLAGSQVHSYRLIGYGKAVSWLSDPERSAQQLTAR